MYRRRLVLQSAAYVCQDCIYDSVVLQGVELNLDGFVRNMLCITIPAPREAFNNNYLTKILPSRCARAVRSGPIGAGIFQRGKGSPVFCLSAAIRGQTGFVRPQIT